MNLEVHNENKVNPFEKSGLGGWLVVIQIGLYLTLLLLLNQIVNYDLVAITGETWDLLTTESSAYYNALWKPYIIFEVTFNILYFLFAIFILVQFYRKKSILPKLMIAFYSISVLIAFIDFTFVQQFEILTEIDGGKSLTSILRSLLTCLIWIPYFIKSERVNNTFVR
ncbi:hypothetical protein D3C77_453030 [compost metagenome]